jgi:5'-phosphate synthase pdxT subunit
MNSLTGLKVGVLALQGDFERHLYRLQVLGSKGYEVRRRDDLAALDGLIIPGGESTTMNLLIDRFEMRESLLNFCRIKGVWGTCAGMIMLARAVDDVRITPLNVIDISVQRNAYGRQVHSFHASVHVNWNGQPHDLSAFFIRAPQVIAYGSGVRVLAEYEEKPVLLAHQNCLVSSFHTELNDDLTLTKYYLENFVSVFK